MLVSHLKTRPVSLAMNFDELFDELFSDRSNVNNKKFMPAVNISESISNYHLEMAIPSFNKDDVNIKIDNYLLTIAGEKKEENVDDSKKIKKIEFHYNSFTRSFTLPKNIETEKIEAKYENGILNLTIPKKEVEKEKNAVEIKIA